MAVVFTRLSMGMATFGINLSGVSMRTAPAESDKKSKGKA